MNAKAVGVTTEPAGAVVLRALELAEQAGIPRLLTYNPSNLATSDRVLAAAARTRSTPSLRGCCRGSRRMNSWRKP